MNIADFSPAFVLIFVGFTLLALIFGFAFNHFVSWLHREGYNEGYVWLEVVVGVLVTLGITAGLAVAVDVDPLALALALVMFIFSGAPMAWGDIRRYVQSRRDEVEMEIEREVGTWHRRAVNGTGGQTNQDVGETT